MIRHICMHDTPYINDDKPYMNDDKPLVYNRTIYRTVYARWYTRYVCMIRHILTMIYQICMHITNMYDTTFHGVRGVFRFWRSDHIASHSYVKFKASASSLPSPDYIDILLTILLYNDHFNKEMCSWNKWSKWLTSPLGVWWNQEERKGHARRRSLELR